MNISARLAVLALYLIIAFGIFLLFAGAGDGSMTPLSIYGSWGIVIARIIKINLIVSLSFIFLYIAFIFYLNSILGRWADKRFPITTAAIHATGSIVALFMLEPHPHPNPGYETAGIIISAIIVMGYLKLDWTLAMGKDKPSKELQ
jgi:hypothetical protein